MMSPLSFIVMLLIMIIIPTLLYSFFFLIRCPPQNPLHLVLRRRRRSGDSSSRREKISGEGDDDDISKNNFFEIVIISSARSKLGNNNETECPVCLSEFAEGEELRQLKICKHLFHKSCIDKWLSSHFNCPVCRAFVAKQGIVKEMENSRGALIGRNGGERDDLWQGLPDSAGLV